MQVKIQRKEGFKGGTCMRIKKKEKKMVDNEVRERERDLLVYTGDCGAFISVTHSRT